MQFLRALRSSCVATVAVLLAVVVPAGAAGSRSKGKPTTNQKTTPAKSEPPKATPAIAKGPQIKSLTIEPAEVTLVGPRAEQTLIVSATYDDGSVRDVTEEVEFVTESARVAAVGRDGVVRPLADGEAMVTAKLASSKLSAQRKIVVKDFSVDRSINFATYAAPVLTRAGCNSSNCHGSPAGKAGFKLSLFGYEPEVDYKALAKDKDGARLNKENPEDSLLLKKPTMQIPHRGGLRFAKGSPEYETLLAWIKTGAPEGKPDDAKLAKVEIIPDHRVLVKEKQQQRLLVTAVYADGTREDVTHKAKFSASDDAIATVDEKGIVTAQTNNGEVPVMVRFAGMVANVNVIVTLGGAAPAVNMPATANVIDEKVFAKLKVLRLAPSELSSDGEFLRRVYLDLIGTLPTVDEARSFLNPEPRTLTPAAKRAKLVEELLARPEYADYWALKWADLLRINARYLRVNGAQYYHDWLREQFKNNTPLNQFAKGILTAEGSFKTNGAVSYFRVSADKEQRVSDTSQIFLGIRIECARCHNHPFEKWTQRDYYGLAGFFNRFATKGDGNNEITGAVTPPTKGERHPKTGEMLKPTPLAGEPLDLDPNEDPRVKFVEWMIAKENPFFARAQANRLWRNFFGRGIVESVDDFRVTNPPTNPELLDALAQELATHNFDQKHLIRLICNSRTYQLSPKPTDTNRQDAKYFARAYARRLPAEVMLDAINQAVGAQDSFGPGASRSMQMTNNLTKAGGGFLDVFNRNTRISICEREEEASVPQVLYLINNPDLHNKIASTKLGRLSQLIRDGKSDHEIVEELTLATLSRLPTPDELKRADELIKSLDEKNKRQAFEDLLWALLTSREFQFNH